MPKISFIKLFILFAFFKVNQSENHRLVNHKQPHHHGVKFHPHHRKEEELLNFQNNSKTNEGLTVIDASQVEIVTPKTVHHGLHPQGRHVCSTTKNVTYPVTTKQTFCKPAYKKYHVRCERNQLCSGVRLVYETHYKDVVTTKSVNEVQHVCCHGWSQATTRSRSCNKPICYKPCLNRGKCVKPDICYCPQGFSGIQCEINLNKPLCTGGCQNGGTCIQPEVCKCPPGFRGRLCDLDINECEEIKPCDQICYNTHGSFTCQCRENFLLQEDKQSCRKEVDDDQTSIEAKEFEMDALDKRLLKLETMMDESHTNDVTKKDIQVLYKDMDHISRDINSLRFKLGDMENYKNDMYVFKNKLYQIEQKAEKLDDLISNYNKMTRFAYHHSFKNFG